MNLVINTVEVGVPRTAKSSGYVCIKFRIPVAVACVSTDEQLTVETYFSELV